MLDSRETGDTRAGTDLREILEDRVVPDGRADIHDHLPPELGARANEGEGRETRRLGVFGLTVVAFFLAEMGDKTQIATVILAARYDALFTVTAGTTLGMMLANVPAVLLGEKAVKVVPIEWVHRIAATVFAAIGIAVLAGVGA